MFQLVCWERKPKKTPKNLHYIKKAQPSSLDFHFPSVVTNQEIKSGFISSRETKSDISVKDNFLWRAIHTISALAQHASPTDRQVERHSLITVNKTFSEKIFKKNFGQIL